MELLFHSSSFDEHLSFECLPPPLPEPGDFRRRLLDDISQHDFSLMCRDGSVSTSRLALFTSSTFFRIFFTTDPGASEFQLNTTRQAARLTVSFMVSGFYEGNVELATAADVLETAILFKAMHRERLRGAIEKELCERVLQGKDNLDLIVEALAVASELDMIKLLNVATALLLERHWHTFLAAFNVNTRHPTRARLFERLTRGDDFFRRFSTYETLLGTANDAARVGRVFFTL